MSLHHWLGWLAFCLAWLWLGQTLQRPLPGPAAIAAFDDGYLIPREFRFAGETFPDREAKMDACLWSGLNGEAAGRTLPSLPPGPEEIENIFFYITCPARRLKRGVEACSSSSQCKMWNAFAQN